MNTNFFGGAVLLAGLADAERCHILQVLSLNVWSELQKQVMSQMVDSQVCSTKTISAKLHFTAVYTDWPKEWV